MKKALIAGLAATMLATAAPVAQVAHAHPTYHYRGGCTVRLTNDTTPTGSLGGKDQWIGEAHAQVTATTATGSQTDPDTSTPVPTAAISFRCRLWRNVSTVLGVELSGSGTGTASDYWDSDNDGDPDPFTATLDEDDTYHLCEEVTIGGEVHGDAGTTFNPMTCKEVERTTTVPEPLTAVPAYGTITITDQGAGPEVTSLFDPVSWACDSTITGSPPVEVVGECTPTNPDVNWTCPQMVVAAWTPVPTAAAGGRVTCDGSSDLDTGVVSFGADYDIGNLGAVTTITCTAYAGPSGLLPPYTVQCGDPDRPAFGG